MTNQYRIYAMIRAMEHIIKNNIQGSIIECGVWRGGNMMLAAKILKDAEDFSRDLYLYDTFAGMSAPKEDDVGIDGFRASAKYEELKNNEGSEWCNISLEEVRDNMESIGYPSQKIHYIKGLVEESIPKFTPSAIALLRLDTDWYESTKHELTYLYPLLVKNGILIVDDYGYWQGSKKALDEYIAENNLSIFLNRIDFSARLALKI